MPSDNEQNKSQKSSFWERQELIADSPLSIREKWALQVIFIFASHRDDGRCFASNENIQSRLSLGASQTSSLINSLAKKGLINNEKTQSGINIRTISWSTLEGFADPETHNSESPDPESRRCGIPDSLIRNPGVPDPDSRRSFNIQNIHRTSIEHPREDTAKKIKKVRFKPEEIELPDSLNNPDFRREWSEWCQYRRENKKSISERTAKLQIATLAKHGPTTAIAALRKSIESGWTGLFPEQISQQGNNNGYSNAQESRRTNSGQQFDPSTRGQKIIV